MNIKELFREWAFCEMADIAVPCEYTKGGEKQKSFELIYTQDSTSIRSKTGLQRTGGNRHQAYQQTDQKLFIKRIPLTHIQ